MPFLVVAEYLNYCVQRIVLKSDKKAAKKRQLENNFIQFDNYHHSNFQNTQKFNKNYLEVFLKLF